MSVVFDANKINWISHVKVKEVGIKQFLTKKDNDADITTLLLNIPKGVSIPEHMHEDQDDNLYIISGKAKMWINGIGEFELKKGLFIRVLKGVKHKIFDVNEEILALDIFNPTTV